MSSVFNEYPVSGVGPYFITFEYQTQEDVFVLFKNSTTDSYDLQPNTNWSFENATTIQLVSPPDSDIEEVRIQRVTAVNPLRAAFYPGSAIRAQDLNANFEQLMMAIEEDRGSGGTSGGGSGSEPGDGTITINQGGTQKGIFTVNQVGNTTIDLDEGGGGSTFSVFVSDTAPPSPNDGDLWYSTTDARLYIYFDDGNTTQWADASPALASGVTQIIAGNNITVSGDGTGIVTIDSTGGGGTAPGDGTITISKTDGTVIGTFSVNQTDDETIVLPASTVPSDPGDGVLTVKDAGGSTLATFSANQATNSDVLLTLPVIPTNNNELANCANYITAAEAPVQPSDIPTVPTTVSSFTNDSNYITSAEAPVQPGDVFSGDYNDLTNKPSIPTVDPDTVVTDQVPTFTVAVQTTERTITAGSFDLSSGNHWTCGAITVPNPSNCVTGTSGLIRITAGPVVWGNYFKFPGGSAPTIASFPAIIPFYVQSASVILLGNVSEGIS